MSKFNEMSINSKSVTRVYRTGEKYKVYYRGDVFKDGESYFRIDNERILDYIFGRPWPGKQKKKLDELIDGYPDAFLKKMKEEEKNDKELQKILAKISPKNMDKKSYRMEEFDLPLKKRLEFISNFTEDTNLDYATKKLVDKTIAEALLLVIKKL